MALCEQHLEFLEEKQPDSGVTHYLANPSRGKNAWVRRRNACGKDAACLYRTDTPTRTGRR